MSGSGGGGSTTTSSLPDWAQPYAKQILERGADLSNQALPQYGGETVAGFTPDQQAAMDMVRNQATQGSGVIGAGNDAITGMLKNGGNATSVDTANPYASQTTSVAANPYMGQNPYLAQQVADAQGKTADAYRTGTASQTMGQFRNAGAFGGSAQQQYTDSQNATLGDTLGKISTDMYGADYANTQQLAQHGIDLQTSTSLADAARNAQYTLGGQQLASQNAQYGNSNILAAAGLAPGLGAANYYDASQLMGLGNTQQAQSQNDLNAAYQQWYNSAMSPYQQLGVLQSALQGAMGAGAQGVTTSSGGKGSALGGALGGATSGAATGAMIGGPWGAAIGGVGGGLMGALSS
jgi:hypothetical protein